MSRTVHARVAGVTFLLYIVTGISSMVIAGRAAGGGGDIAARLANMALHPGIMRMNVMVALLSALYALVLGVTLYGLTRTQDPELALMALCCRGGEAVINAVSCLRSLALFSIATAGADAGGQAVAAVLFRMGNWTTLISATCFAVGSTLFSYLFLRARSIPVWLAWLGVMSSLFLVAVLPLQLLGIAKGTIVTVMWLPILVFELVLAFWLIVKGVAAPRGEAA